VTSDPDAVAWSAFVAEAERRLRDAGIEAAPIEARRIVEAASGHEGSEFHLGMREPATTRGVAHFDHLLERRLQGEPLQYVLGAWGFRTLDLFVDRRVLIPRPETESVVDLALAEIDRCREAGDRSLTVLDLGTGSGAIALSIAAERDGVEVWATDVSADALDVARSNLAGLGRKATRVRLAQGSWFDAVPGELRGAIDVIISNPPYVAATDELPDEVSQWEPDLALVSGESGYEALDQVVAASSSWLRDRGALVVELAPSQAAAVAANALRHGFRESEVRRDLTGRDRAVIARR
jgi:release factor glutamine methyltransferase